MAERPRTRPDDLWLEIGIVAKPHGLKGDLYFKPHSGELTALAPERLVRLEVRGRRFEDRIVRFRPFKKGAILTLRGCQGIAAAERLRGARLSVRRADLGPLADDEVYVNDLLGLEAVLPGGEVAGRVTAAYDTGPIVSLLIEGPLGGTVPFHDDWVGEIDFEAGRLQLRRRPIA